MIKQRYATPTRALGLALLGIALWSEVPAHALQGGEDPSLLPVLIDKRFGMAGRHQLTLEFSTAMATKYVDAIAIFGAYQYNFNDLFGLELGGGYFFGSEASIMKEVRKSTGNGTIEPRLSDLYQLQFLVGLEAVLTPIYGKMSFASEFDPGYDVFFLLGGGLAGTRRQFGVVLDDGTSPKPVSYHSKIGPQFNFGVGLHVYLTKLISLRVELRDYFYPEPFDIADHNPAEFSNATEEPGGFTFNLHFQAGLSFALGGP